MRSRKTVSLTMTALASFVIGTLSVPGCGDSDTEIKEERPPQEALKDSMDYMKSYYAKKGKSSKSSKSQPQAAESKKTE